MPRGVNVASESIIIGQLLVSLRHLLCLMVVKSLCAVSVELGLVLVALDHLLKMLLHGKLT